MFSLSSAVVTLALTSSAFAALAVTSPTESISFVGGQQANITWVDNGAEPSLASFGLAKVSVFTGNSNSQTSLQLIAENVDVTNPLFLLFTPDPSIGPSATEYFIRFESNNLKDTANPNIPALAFSHVFTMSGMTGTFNATIQSEIDGQSTAPFGGSAAASTTAATQAATTPKASTTAANKSAAPSSSASKSAKAAAASGSSAAVPAFVAGQNLWLGILTGVFGAVMGAALL
ncbi:hypothetical protein B0H13DRAFT_1975336 [Mycena leptocephala]|nr:hypothetical protein B0H13DRAFT_1975336 [Mycena leptocephala]